MSLMLAWSGHSWRSLVTSGKRDICKLQPGHDDEGCLKSTSSEKGLKAGVEVSTEGGT